VFSDCASPVPGWVSVLTTRAVYRDRRRAPLGFSWAARDEPDQCGPVWAGRRKRYLDSYGIKLRADRLHADSVHGPAGDDSVFTRVAFTRSYSAPLVVPNAERSVWWCVTNHDDLRSLTALKSGQIPAGQKLIDVVDQVNPAVIFALVKTWPNGRQTRCAIELNPKSGRLLSFRTAVGMPLEIVCGLDRLEPTLVTKAARYCLSR
jgi:hypothetical protein